jgi:ATP-binding cassette, subfamily C, bacterial
MNWDSGAARLGTEDSPELDGGPVGGQAAEEAGEPAGFETAGAGAVDLAASADDRLTARLNALEEAYRAATSSYIGPTPCRPDGGTSAAPRLVAPTPIEAKVQDTSAPPATAVTTCPEPVADRLRDDIAEVARSLGHAQPSPRPGAAALPVADDDALAGLRDVTKPAAEPGAPVGHGPTTRIETRAPAPATTQPDTSSPSQGKVPDARPSGSDGGGGSGGGRSGGGGGSGGGAPLEQRSGDRDFREVLGRGLSACRRNLITVGIFSFWVNLLVLALPIYLFQVSDRVLTSRSVDTLIMLTVVVVGAVAAHVFMDTMRRIILTRIATEAESRLGAPVLSAAAKASQSGSSREFQTLADLQQLRQFITGPVLLTMFDAPVAPIYLLAVFLMHPALGFIVTTTGIALLVVALLNQKLTAVPFARANAYATRANLQAEAMARNAQVINAMGMIPEGVTMWGRETVESLKAQVIAQDRSTLMTGISKLIRLCTQIAILGYGAWLALDAHVTAGVVIAASIVASRALAPIEGTIEGWRNFVQARSAYARIKALLQSSPLNYERLRLPRPQGRVNVERLLYVPPPNKKVILNGVTFQLEPGESLAIVGASGAGKSTIARMLVGSITPTAGNVRLDAMDLRNWDSRQFGESVGYLPQDVQLFPASIKANIARMREDATDEAIYNAAEMADVHEMISQFAAGYETFVAADGSPLSGGQKQRIGLARAFFGDPRLVVLDEPNSNLDAPGERALARALGRAKQNGTSVVAITQRPALLKSVDKILVLKDGTVQALGKRDDIMPLLSGRKAGNGSGPPPGDGAAFLEQ